MRRTPWLLALLLAGCGHAPTAEPTPLPTPRVLYTPADHGADFSADQTVDAVSQGHRYRFRALLEKEGAHLTLVGLTPFGARAYTLEQEGTEVHVTMHIARDLPFPPEYVVLDVHRTYLLGFPAAPFEGATRTFDVADARITDTLAGGRIRTRRVEVTDPAEVIEIDYGPEGMPLDGTPPARVVVRHSRLGYELTITTSGYRRSPSP